MSILNSYSTHEKIFKVDQLKILYITINQFQILVYTVLIFKKKWIKKKL